MEHWREQLEALGLQPWEEDRFKKLLMSVAGPIMAITLDQMPVEGLMTIIKGVKNEAEGKSRKYDFSEGSPTMYHKPLTIEARKILFREILSRCEEAELPPDVLKDIRQLFSPLLELTKQKTRRKGQVQKLTFEDLFENPADIGRTLDAMRKAGIVNDADDAEIFIMGKKVVALAYVYHFLLKKGLLKKEVVRQVSNKTLAEVFGKRFQVELAERIFQYGYVFGTTTKAKPNVVADLEEVFPGYFELF